MHLIKISLLLSLMSLCHTSQVQGFSDKLSRSLQCLETINEGIALVMENSIPTLKILVLCIDYRPRMDRSASFLKYIRIVHQFAKRAIYHKPDCLLQLFSVAVELLRPVERKLNQLRCFDD
ncbi:accessory gland protein Acp53Ea [Drosophila guanche]|uniref:Blast:Accessory gland protein Acp53Ea n=1 Tax=Drosophila guanche TaxID=7266 RepID=A0A3B0JC46_DROGU|nr:accessory gland protein Acp53Ea [Drosophila guanche]SPP72790.1 blast:Accessory gland protein Acp53Ea [Drosophila guanche]